MHYEMVPEGMVSRFVPTSATIDSGSGTGGAVTSVENVAVADDVTAERFVNNTHSGIISQYFFPSSLRNNRKFSCIFRKINFIFFAQ